jgi:hypothetical protein
VRVVVDTAAAVEVVVAVEVAEAEVAVVTNRQQQLKRRD